MRAITLTAVLMSTALGFGTFAEGATPSNPPPQVSMTRLMIVFAGIERNLADAVSRHDQTTTDKLLSPDFEFRPDAHPGEPTTRADWLADNAMHGTGTDQLSVRELGDVAVVSFVTRTTANASSYVIDVWKQQGDTWQLITRYQSKLPNAEAPTEDKAPTGKG